MLRIFRSYGGKFLGQIISSSIPDYMDDIAYTCILKCTHVTTLHNFFFI